MSLRAHQDFRGHHPTVRPYTPHINKEGHVKVVSRVPLILHLSDNEDEWLEPVVVEMGCSEPKMWYVDTASCGRLQASFVFTCPLTPPYKRFRIRRFLNLSATQMRCNNNQSNYSLPCGVLRPRLLGRVSSCRLCANNPCSCCPTDKPAICLCRIG